MAVVYGYFVSDEQARKASRRLEQQGRASTLMAQSDRPHYIDEEAGKMAPRHSRRNLVRGVVVLAALVTLFGAVVFTVIPALWGKVVIAGPLLTALYGVAVGVALYMIVSMRRYDEMAEPLPEEIARHVIAPKVVVVSALDAGNVAEIEKELEAEGAVEVIHRAA